MLRVNTDVEDEYRCDCMNRDIEGEYRCDWVTADVTMNTSVSSLFTEDNQPFALP